jgi:hypothetical protein
MVPAFDVETVALVRDAHLSDGEAVAKMWHPASWQTRRWDTDVVARPGATL